MPIETHETLDPRFQIYYGPARPYIPDLPKLEKAPEIKFSTGVPRIEPYSGFNPDPNFMVSIPLDGPGFLD